MTATSFRIVIPARHDSTRLPGKPLIEVAGRPLVEHVWRSACAAGAEEVLIATDDRRIAEVAENFGAHTCLTRSDHASGTDRLAEVAARAEWDDDAIVVNLQGDEPLTPPAVLQQVAANLAAHPQASMATLATPFTTAEDVADPNLVKVVTDHAGYALYFSRSPVPFDRDRRQVGGTGDRSPHWRHIGLYAYRCGFLRRYTELPVPDIERREALEQLRALWHGYRIHVAEAVALPAAGVDTAADIERVARLLATD